MQKSNLVEELNEEFSQKIALFAEGLGVELSGAYDLADTLSRIKRKFEQLKERENMLDWMLKHGARVYNYQEYTGRRDGCGYYCSYHPHKGPSDTPIEALALAIKYDEQNRKKI